MLVILLWMGLFSWLNLFFSLYSMIFHEFSWVFSDFILFSMIIFIFPVFSLTSLIFSDFFLAFLFFFCHFFWFFLFSFFKTHLYVFSQVICLSVRTGCGLFFLTGPGIYSQFYWSPDWSPKIPILLPSVQPINFDHSLLAPKSVGKSKSDSIDMIV